MPKFSALPCAEAYIDFTEVELGFVVDLRTLKETLKSLSVNGRRWWIASDPQDAVEDGFISIGFGHPDCVPYAC